MADIASDSKTVLLVMGSIRAGRVCPKVTDWVAAIGKDCTGLNYEVLDLADWPLPMDDEPGIPALGAYSQAHTRAWSEKVKAAAAVVFVTPQFNWGYPAVLKNAVDHLYHEWHGKPVAVVTYGGHGGTRCAKQLRQVAVAVKMRVVSVAPALYLPEAVIRHGAEFEPEQDFLSHRLSVQRALTTLAVMVEGKESTVNRAVRQIKAAYAAIS